MLHILPNLLGPPATTLVRYGAKYGGLIVYEKQWWRLISPIAVHAGIIHLISNVLIQVFILLRFWFLNFL
jgi:membrane associated rhomboid family serine protease